MKIQHLFEKINNFAINVTANKNSVFFLIFCLPDMKNAPPKQRCYDLPVAVIRPAICYKPVRRMTIS